MYEFMKHILRADAFIIKNISDLHSCFCFHFSGLLLLTYLLTTKNNPSLLLTLALGFIRKSSKWIKYTNMLLAYHPHLFDYTEGKEKGTQRYPHDFVRVSSFKWEAIMLSLYLLLSACMGTFNRQIIPILCSFDANERRKEWSSWSLWLMMMMIRT